MKETKSDWLSAVSKVGEEFSRGLSDEFHKAQDYCVGLTPSLPDGKADGNAIGTALNMMMDSLICTTIGESLAVCDYHDSCEEVFLDRANKWFKILREQRAKKNELAEQKN